MSGNIASDRLTDVLSGIWIILKEKQHEKSPVKKVTVSGQQIRVSCRNVIVADAIFQLYPSLQDTGFGLTIEVEGGAVQAFPPCYTPMASTTIMTNILKGTQSEWLKTSNNILLLEDFLDQRGSVSFHSTDRDTGYRCLDVYPFLGLDMVLNRDREELINKPIDASGFIGSKKKEAVEQAIASRGRVQLGYDYQWGETSRTIQNWEMGLTAIYQGREVIVISSNLKDSQKKFWQEIARAKGN
jgi:hypothetical protein